MNQRNNDAVIASPAAIVDLSLNKSPSPKEEEKHDLRNTGKKRMLSTSDSEEDKQSNETAKPTNNQKDSKESMNYIVHLKCNNTQKTKNKNPNAGRKKRK